MGTASLFYACRIHILTIMRLMLSMSVFLLVIEGMAASGERVRNEPPDPGSEKPVGKANPTQHLPAPGRIPFSFKQEEDPVAYAAGGRLALRRNQIYELIRHPDPKFLKWLADILQSAESIHSPLAAVAIGRLRSPDSVDLLEKALNDKRSMVRTAALSGLVDNRALSAEDHALRMLKDPDPNVIATAAVGVGKLREKRALQTLKTLTQHRRPVVRMSAAWALARMGRDEGVKMLEQIALAGDPHTSPRAVMAIAALDDRYQLPLLYRLLFSRTVQVRNAALHAVSSFSAKEREAALEGLPPGDVSALRLREKLLLCAAGKGPIPVECQIMLQRGEERLLALSCVEKAGSLSSLPATVSCLKDEDAVVRLAADVALRALVERHKKKDAPGGNTKIIAWQRWWFSCFSIAMTGPGRAVLIGPTTRYRVETGTRLEWGALVTKIQPGTGRLGAKNGIVRLQIGTEIIEIK